jgi:hypothetical protein
MSETISMITNSSTGDRRLQAGVDAMTELRP